MPDRGSARGTRMTAAGSDPAGGATAPVRPRPLGRDVSEAIRVARVLCIGFMMTVHVWPGATRILGAETAAPLGVFYAATVDVLGRAAVPLLGIVSGYLLFRGLLQRPGAGAAVIRGKARVLLLPMAAWSLVLLVVNAAGARALGLDVALPRDPLDWLNAVLAVSAPPYNAPLGFLRDIFLCAAVAVGLMPLLRRRPCAALGLAVALNVADHAAGGVLLLRPSIMSFYILGFLAVLHPDPGALPRWPVLVALVAADAALQLSVQEPLTGAAGILANLLHRLAVAAVMWRTALAVARGGGALLAAVKAVEPSIFFIFCSHMVTVGALAALLTILGADAGDPVFAAVFLCQIGVIFSAGLGVHRLIAWHWPQALVALAGAAPKGGRRSRSGHA